MTEAKERLESSRKKAQGGDQGYKRLNNYEQFLPSLNSQEGRYSDCKKSIKQFLLDLVGLNSSEDLKLYYPEIHEIRRKLEHDFGSMGGPAVPPPVSTAGNEAQAAPRSVTPAPVASTSTAPLPRRPQSAMPFSSATAPGPFAPPSARVPAFRASEPETAPLVTAQPDSANLPPMFSAEDVHEAIVNKLTRAKIVVDGQLRDSNDFAEIAACQTKSRQYELVIDQMKSGNLVFDGGKSVARFLMEDVARSTFWEQVERFDPDIAAIRFEIENQLGLISVDVPARAQASEDFAEVESRASRHSHRTPRPPSRSGSSRHESRPSNAVSQLFRLAVRSSTPSQGTRRVASASSSDAPRSGRPPPVVHSRPPSRMRPTFDESEERMPVSDLLISGHERFRYVVDAAKEARAGRTEPEVTARRSRRGSGSLAGMLLDERGTVRKPEELEPHLSGFDAGSRPRLERLLNRLNAHIEGSAIVDHECSPMQAITIGRDNAPGRTVIVGDWTVDPGPDDSARLEKIYAQNPELIRAPRSFDGDRLRQTLRWLSTTLSPRFKRATEVQCYWEEQGRNIIVSSNSTSANQKIQSFLTDGSMEQALSELLESRPSTARTYGVTPPARRERHGVKLAERRDPASNPHAGTEADAVLAAIVERRFVVPLREYYWSNGRLADMHGERRIGDYLKENSLPPMNVNMLAGTMRSCGVCADKIGAGPAERRGPVWGSGSAAYDANVDEVVNRSQEQGAGTSITRTRRGELTFTHDTDSNSGVSPSPAPKDRKKQEDQE